MENERKCGENEAATILQNIGIELDLSYCDDNSHDSMPDLKCKNGRWIEVTHTDHNGQLFNTESPNNYINDMLKGDPSAMIQKNLQLEEKCREALCRIQNGTYTRTMNNQLTDDARKLFNQDCKLIKSHFGYDLCEMNYNKQHSEFKCDIPIVEFSVDNIERKIYSKAKKHDKGDTDLFIFVAEQEYKFLVEYFTKPEFNEIKNAFLKRLYYVSFREIYICEWNITTRRYNTNNPHMVRFSKEADKLNCKWYNGIE